MPDKSSIEALAKLIVTIHNHPDAALLLLAGIAMVCSTMTQMAIANLR